MRNRVHNVLAPPPRSLLRKRSAKTQNRHMNQANQMKNSNVASKNDPLSSNTSVPLLISADRVGDKGSISVVPVHRVLMIAASSAMGYFGARAGAGPSRRVMLARSAGWVGSTYGLVGGATTTSVSGSWSM